jgi:predicted nuclease with TOPRIM domain
MQSKQHFANIFDGGKKKMTIEVSLLLSGVSIAFAIFFGISTRNRNVKKDTQDEAREDATILTKLENIQNTMIEVKSEMGSYRNEMKEIREYYIRASESLKQLHKRVDRIDKIIDESHPHQYIEEQQEESAWRSTAIQYQQAEERKDARSH